MDLIETLKLETVKAQAGEIPADQFDAVSKELSARVEAETASLRASGQRNFVTVVDNLLATFKSLAPKVEEKVDESPKVYNNNKKATR
jgi:hypothetical protein